MLWKAASYIHEGNGAEAMRVMEERRAIAEGNADWLAVSFDDVLIGRTLLEMGDVASASERFASAIVAVEKADVPADIETARAKSAAYDEAVAVTNVAFEARQNHELMGRIALAEGNGEEALTHLAHANHQDPRVLLLMAEAEAAAGNPEAAAELARGVQSVKLPAVVRSRQGAFDADRLIRR